MERATKILLDYEAQEPPILNISFLSASSFPLALPGTVARGFGWPKWNLGVEGANSLVVPIFLEELAKCSMIQSESYTDEKAAYKPVVSNDTYHLLSVWRLVRLLMLHWNSAGKEGWID